MNFVKKISKISIVVVMLFASTHCAYGMDQEQLQILGSASASKTLTEAINHSIKIIEPRLGEGWNRPTVEKRPSDKHIIEVAEEEQCRRGENLEETEHMVLPFVSKWNVNNWEMKVNCQYSPDEQIIVHKIKMMINNSLEKLQKESPARTSSCIKTPQPLKDVSNIREAGGNSLILKSLMTQIVQSISFENDAGSTETY